MSKSNNILTVLALVISIAAMVISLVLPGPAADTADYSAEIEALRQQNALLQSQVDALSAQLGSGSANSGAALSGWELALAPWDTGTGASVTLTAMPTAYEEGMEAALYVRKGSQEIVTVPCSWTGDAFTATAELTAQDGYGYYCILTDAHGKRQQFALTTPDNPVEDIPVYLAASLNAYCNMTMDSWLDLNNTLTISAAYVQAQLPRLTADGREATIEKAEVVLYYRGEVCARAPITLEAGIAPGSYECTVSGVSMPMPEMEQDESLDLYLEITLSDGHILSAPGASWFCNDDGLFAVVG